MGVTLVEGKQHNVIKRDGRIEPFSWDKLNKVLKWAATHRTGISENMVEFMIKEIKDNMNLRIFDKIKIEKLFDETIDVAANLADRMYPEYDLIARNLFIQKIYKETWGIKRNEYPDYKEVVKKGLQYGVYGAAFESLSDEDIEELGSYIDSSYDFVFNSFLGISTFFNKYCKNYTKTKKLELPQHAMMRIAVQAFYTEAKNQRIELMKKFYDVIRNHLISRATPYYINAGGPKPMLSSCVLVAADDDSYSINKACNNIGMYSREGGGTALDISPVRSIDAVVDKTGRSSGKIPFIKMVESVISAYNQKSARPGACAVYFNWWDYEVMDLLMLKDEGGSEERRARKLQYAVKLNDIFVKALLADKDIYLFDPKDTPELLELHGDDFSMKYFEYANKAGIRKKKIKARELGYLIAKIRNETGNLYIFFDDNVNENTPFKEKIRQSNLCFTGDTLVYTVDRGLVPIEQLAQESQGKKRFKVYCSHPTSNGWSEPIIKEAVAFMTGTDNTIKLTLSDGSIIKCTPDHKIALAEGGYIEARNSIQCYVQLADNRAVFVQKIEHNPVEIVYDLTVEDTHNFYIVDENTDSKILVHNCTEITLPTKPTLMAESKVVQEWDKDKPQIETKDYGEIALCNLSAINAVEWTKLDERHKQELTYLLARAFDNEVETMYYAAREGEIANKLYRSIGIGVNGLAAYFAFNKVKFTDPKSFKLEFDLFEDIYYHVYSASVAIAKERGPFPRFKQTKWAEGWLPIDYFKEEFDKYAEDWQAARWEQLREDIMKYGIRFATSASVAPGACQTKDGEIITTDGIKSIEQILKENNIDYEHIEQNNLIGWYNFETPVEVHTRHGVYESERIWYNGMKEVYEIEFEDGSKYKFTGNHMLLVRTKEGAEKWVKVSELQEDMEVISISAK